MASSGSNSSSTSKYENPQYQNALIDKIMNIDEHNVRFVAICDMDGQILTSSTKKGITPLLSPEETKELLQHTVNSWKSRMKYKDKIGKGKFMLAVYEKLRRVSLLLDDNHILLVSIDNKGGQMSIVEALLAIIEGDYTKPHTVHDYQA